MNDVYITKILENSGLSRQEIALYVSVVGQTERTATELAKIHRLPRSTIRSQLERLIEKGVVVSRYEKNTQYYQAASPEAIVRYAEAELHAQQNRVASLRVALPELVSALGTPTAASRSYVGVESVAVELRSLLAARPVCACLFDHPAVAQALEGDAFLGVAPTTGSRVLVRRGLSVPVQWLAERRFFASELAIGAVCLVLEEAVAIIQPTEGDSSLSLLIVDQPALARVCTVLFDSLWRTSSSVA